MSSIKLDKNRSYGTIHGKLEDKPAARFEQDGRLFDASGDVILTDAEKEAEIAAIEAHLTRLKKTETVKLEVVAPVVEPAPVVIPPADVSLPATTEAKTAKSTKKGGSAIPDVKD